MDVPERRNRRRELYVAAEAREARLVREALLHEVEELFQRPVTRVAQFQAAPLTALPAAHVDPHRGSTGGGRPLLDALGGGEEGVAGAGGEDADRHRLGHALALLHEERAPHEAAFAVG